MTNYLAPLPLPKLAALTRNLKNGVLDVLNMPADEIMKGNLAKKECPPAAAFQVAMAGLVAFEREIRRRNLDPADPIFGPNIVPEIAEIWAEEATGI